MPNNNISLQLHILHVGCVCVDVVKCRLIVYLIAIKIYVK